MTLSLLSLSTLITEQQVRLKLPSIPVTYTKIFNHKKQVTHFHCVS